MWKRACNTAAKCIAEAKEYNKKRYYKTHMEPDFKEGDQVLVSGLNFNDLKGPKKMRNLFTGEDKFPSRKKTTTLPEIVEVGYSPRPMKTIIKARNIRLNGKDQRQYLVRFKNLDSRQRQMVGRGYHNKWELHLRRLRASRRTENSHQL
ncbi:hypothetical protein O181_000200 [Austropuccinia psidii MF-1]|uniref:Uncharacterized protein n=1 Tax=Austropuccinia psidii MF-1 TaxID=1389203 RepID=A0A9Q3B8G9_9BASI|nr:hypothetical protein [Austropuccinia psidii MF-1]